MTPISQRISGFDQFHLCYLCKNAIYYIHVWTSNTDYPTAMIVPFGFWTTDDEWHITTHVICLICDIPALWIIIRRTAHKKSIDRRIKDQTKAKWKNYQCSVPNLSHLFSHVNHTCFNPEIFTCDHARILTCKLGWNCAKFGGLKNFTPENFRPEIFTPK